VFRGDVLVKYSFCGKEELLPFKCPYCGGNFCIEYRLPENHNCTMAPPRTPLGPAQYPGKNPYILTIPKHKRDANALSRLFRKVPVGKIVGGILLALIVGILLLKGPILVAIIQDFLSFQSYTRVKVIAGTLKTIEIEGNEYTFYYDSKKGILKVGVGIVPFATGNYVELPLMQETKFKVYGIEIIVSEGYTDYLILLIRPL